MPRGDSKIKEKLNLHVKKRLQETAKSSTKTEPPTPPPSSTSSAGSLTTPGPSPGSKTKKQKTKHSQQSSATATSTSSNSSFNLSGGSSSSKAPTVTAEHLMLSPGALGGGNSNDTTNSSFNSVDLDPDANLSNDGQATEKSSPGGSGKATPKADIFTMILNEKKNSLMRDPEVIKFLRDLMDKRDKP